MTGRDDKFIFLNTGRDGRAMGPLSLVPNVSCIPYNVRIHGAFVVLGRVWCVGANRWLVGVATDNGMSCILSSTLHIFYLHIFVFFSYFCIFLLR